MSFFLIVTNHGAASPLSGAQQTQQQLYQPQLQQQQQQQLYQQQLLLYTVKNSGLYLIFPFLKYNIYAYIP